MLLACHHLQATGGSERPRALFCLPADVPLGDYPPCNDPPGPILHDPGDLAVLRDPNKPNGTGIREKGAFQWGFYSDRQNGSYIRNLIRFRLSVRGCKDDGILKRLSIS